MLWKSYKDELDAVCVNREAEQRFYRAANKAAARHHVSFYVQTAVGLTLAACVAIASVGIGFNWLYSEGPPVYTTVNSRTTDKPDNTTGQYPAESKQTESGPPSSAESDDNPDACAIPGKFKAMTEAEIAAYLGRNPLPDDLHIPNGLTLKNIPRGIYEGEAAEQLPRTQFITYLYTDGTDDPRQTMEITVAKRRLPKLDEWKLGKPTTINGTTVHWYIYDDRPYVGNSGTIFYHAYMLIDKVGYSVVTQNLPEEDFWAVVKSIA